MTNKISHNNKVIFIRMTCLLRGGLNHCMYKPSLIRSWYFDLELKSNACMKAFLGRENNVFKYECLVFPKMVP